MPTSINENTDNNDVKAESTDTADTNNTLNQTETVDSVSQEAVPAEEKTAEADIEETTAEDTDEQFKGVLQQIRNFENSEEIQKKLREIISDYGKKVWRNKPKFIGLVNDYLAGYDRERRLLVNSVNIGVLKHLILDGDEIVFLREKDFVMEQLFVVEEAAEFVVAAFSYMIGREYISPMRVTEETIRAEKEAMRKAAEAKKQSNIAKIPADLFAEKKVFGKLDGFRFKLSKNVVIPEGFTKIDDFSFDGNGMMRTITFPSTMIAIGDYAFSDCRHLQSVELPKYLRKISAFTFTQCSDLEEVKIPAGVQEINENAFSFCSNLKKVSIPSTVTSIGESAFLCCESLKKLYLPASIKFIDKNAFRKCSKLTVYCYENSYVHKYCMNNDIKTKTAPEGVDLHDIDKEEEE